MFLKQIKIVAVFSVLLLLACSGEAPQLIETWHQLNLVNDPARGFAVQSLSFFLHGRDEDGENDLEQIYLIYDDLELFWNIPLEKWSSYTEKDVKWIGFNGLLAPADGVFPEGNYRVLLVDIGGERDEKTFYLKNNIPLKDDLTYPEITFDRNNLSINSDFLKFQIWFYDGEEQLLEKSREFMMGNYQWNDIVRNISRRATSFKVYTEPESGSWGLISGPYFYSD